MKNRLKISKVSLISALFLLGACTQSVGITPTPQSTNSSGQAGQPSFSQFQDIPIPTGARMNLDRTVILGAPESWIGRLTLDANHNPAVLFDFFKQRTPEFGWQEVTTVRAATSFMTYTRSNRVLNIQIKAKTLQGSEVDLTVSPKGQPTESAPMRAPQGSRMQPPLQPAPPTAGLPPVSTLPPPPGQ